MTCLSAVSHSMDTFHVHVLFSAEDDPICIHDPLWDVPEDSRIDHRFLRYALDILLPAPELESYKHAWSTCANRMLLQVPLWMRLRIAL